MTDHLLTVKEVAERCRIHEMTVRRHIREGRLRALRVGRSLRVRELELQSYMAAAETQPGKPLDENDPIFSLAGAFRMSEPADVSGDKYRALAEIHARATASG